MGHPRREAILELVFVVGVPTVVLVFFSGDAWLGPVWALIVALVFPLAHGVRVLVAARRLDPLVALVLISILLTGGIGLLELDPAWFALKEALVPVVMGVAILASAATRWPVVGVVLEALLDRDAVDAALQVSGGRVEWEAAIRTGTVRLAGLTFLTAGGSWALARYLVVSPTGTPEFTTELGHYTAVGLPVLGLPSMLLTLLVLRAVLDGLERASGTPVEDLLRPGLSDAV